MTRVYKLGNNIAIEENTEIVMLIPCRSLRIEPENNFVCIHDLEVQRTRNINYTDIQDKNGILVGSKQDVIAYLSPFVGFDFASTASATIWGQIIGNIADQNDLQLSLQSVIDFLQDGVSLDGDTLNKLNNKISGIQTLLNSDNVNLDTVQELVDAIENIQLSLSTILVNDLTTGGVTKALTAQQGVVLKGLIDSLTTIVNGKADLVHSHTISNIVNLQTVLDQKQSFDLVLKLNSNISTTSTTSSDAGLNINLTAGKLYKLTLLGKYQSVATTTGIKVGFVAPSGTYNVTGTLKGLVSINTSNTEQHCSIHTINTSSITVGSFILTTGVGAVNTPHFVGGEIFIECLTSGQIRLQLASEVAGSSTQLNAGTALILKQLN